MTAIGEQAFRNAFSSSTDVVDCLDLSSNTSLKTIGSYCFYEAPFATVILPITLQHIYSNAFNNCANLDCVNLDELSNLTDIDGGAFQGTKLSEINFNDNLVRIGNRAFSSCSSLTAIHFGENSKLNTIEPYVFDNCPLLGGILYIPESVRYIGSYAFGQIREGQNYGCFDRIYFNWTAEDISTYAEGILLDKNWHPLIGENTDVIVNNGTMPYMWNLDNFFDGGWIEANDVTEEGGQQPTLTSTTVDVNTFFSTEGGTLPSGIVTLQEYYSYETNKPAWAIASINFDSEITTTIEIQNLVIPEKWKDTEGSRLELPIQNISSGLFPTEIKINTLKICANLQFIGNHCFERATINTVHIIDTGHLYAINKRAFYDSTIENFSYEQSTGESRLEYIGERAFARTNLINFCKTTSSEK